MCLAVYVATAASFETTLWRKDAPAFHVMSCPTPARLRERFEPRPVYYAGSHEGCGCGFLLYDGLEGEDLVRWRATIDAFIAFVRRVAPVDVFVCWEGEQESDPTWEKSVTTSEAASVDLWRDAFAAVGVGLGGVVGVVHVQRVGTR
jgi:hypothetical protein